MCLCMCSECEEHVCCCAMNSDNTFMKPMGPSLRYGRLCYMP
jgi:hypothetical protein